MNQIRRILIIISIILIILILIYVNYNDISWSVNKNSYIGLMICVVNIWALFYFFKGRK
jgi:hypothetical protein